MNQALFLWIHNFSGRSAFWDYLGIFIAQWMQYVMVLAFLVLVFAQPTLRRRLYLFAEAALAIMLSRGIIATTIHFFYNHPRPFEVYGFAPLVGASGASFPSGHATWFFALAMTIWFANRKWGWWFFILATLMGIARIYAGVHWPLDILGGAAIGIASAWFVHWLLRDEKKELG